MESFSDLNAPFFVVAEAGGKVIGYIEIGNRSEFDHGGESIWIHTISVLPEYQGKGVSHKLLENGVERAHLKPHLKDRKQLVLFTHTWTPRAVAFWEKEGFHQDGAVQNETIKMVKSLEHTE